VQEDDKFEYADAIRIENLVKNYSQFISFPIYTWQEKSREKEVLCPATQTHHTLATIWNVPIGFSART
jgi:HSP90 family molecular chaperone